MIATEMEKPDFGAVDALCTKWTRERLEDEFRQLSKLLWDAVEAIKYTKVKERIDYLADTAVKYIRRDAERNPCVRRQAGELLELIEKIRDV